MRRSQLVFWPLFAAVLVVALIHGGRFAYQLLYIFSAVMLFSLLFAIGVRLAVRLRVILPRRYAVTGQRMYWRVILRSNFILPIPALRLRFHKAPGMEGTDGDTLHIKPYQKVGLDVEQIFTCRGNYRVGVSKWHAADYMALFWASRRIRQTAEITVLPRVIMLDGADGGRPIIESAARIPTAQPEFDGIRPYENTDTIRSIHWKLSSKTDNWMVKKTCGMIPAPVCVLIDMTAVPCDAAVRAAREDKLLETALSAIRQLLRSGPVDVVTVAQETGRYTVRSKPEFMELYRTIGLSEFEVGVPDTQISGLNIDPRAALWAVSSHSGASILELLALQFDRGSAYWLYIPSGDECSPDEQAALDRASGAGIAAAAILPGEDIRRAAWMFCL